MKEKERIVIIVLALLIVVMIVIDIALTGNFITKLFKKSDDDFKKSSTLFHLTGPGNNPKQLYLVANVESYPLFESYTNVNLPFAQGSLGISDEEFTSIFKESTIETSMDVSNDIYVTSQNEDFGIIKKIYATQVSWPYNGGQGIVSIDFKESPVKDLTKAKIYFCQNWDFENHECSVPWTEGEKLFVSMNPEKMAGILIADTAENYEAFAITVEYICGDLNNDGLVNTEDLGYLIDYLFRGGPESDPSWVANVNGYGGVDISDVVYFVDYLWRSGPALVCAPPVDPSKSEGTGGWTIQDVQDYIDEAQG